MKKLLIACAGVLFVACADSPTAPDPASAPAPRPAVFDSTFTCRSGYVIAYMEDGTPYCTPEGGTMSTTSGGRGKP